MIHVGLGIADAKGDATAAEIGSQLPEMFLPKDEETVEIDRLLIDEGMSPYAAANHMFDTGCPRRGLDGLKDLARRRELVLLKHLYSSDDELIEKISATGSACMSIRRASIVAKKCGDIGLKVEIVTTVRIRD